MASSAVVISDDVTGAAAAVRSSGRENGWLTASTTSVMSGGAMLREDRQPNSLPIATSAANGMRNFTDAASQTPYRTWARLFRNASVRSPAAPRKTVDCQRWLPTISTSFDSENGGAWVMATCPFSQSCGASSPLPARPRA